MRTVEPLLMTLLLASSVLAHEFRGTRLGESCEHVLEREAALGSVQVATPDKLVFQGTALGRSVRITYLCPNNLLALGDYHFPEASFAAAAADYDAVFSHFQSLYGAAALAMRSNSPIEPADHRDTTATWTVGTMTAMLAMTRKSTDGQVRWRAFAVVMLQRETTRPNQSREPSREP